MAEMEKDLAKLSDEKLRQVLDQIQGQLLTGELSELDYNAVLEAVLAEMQKRGMGRQDSPSLLECKAVRIKSVFSKLRKSILRIEDGVVCVAGKIGDKVKTCRISFNEEAVSKAFRRGALYISKLLADEKDAVVFSTNTEGDTEPLFDLCLVPHARQVMFEKEELRGSTEDVAYFYGLRDATKQLRGGARASVRKDEVVPGRFVSIRPAARSAHPEYNQDARDIVASFEESCFPLTVYDRRSNVDVQIHKKGLKVYVWTDTGRDITAKVPDLVGDLRTNYADDDMVFLANLQPLAEGVPEVSSIELMDILNGANRSDVFIRALVYDTLYYNRDVHFLGHQERCALFSKPAPHVLRCDSREVTNGKSLIPTMNYFKKCDMCTGVLFYRNDPHSLEATPAIRFDKTVEFRAVVLGVKETIIPGVSNFSIGIQGSKNLNFSDGDLVLNNEGKFVRLGDTLSTTRWSYPGDIVEISARTIMHVFDGSEHALRALDPRVVNKITTVGYPNDVAGVLKEASKRGVCFSKVLEDGKIVGYHTNISDRTLKGFAAKKSPNVDVKSEKDAVDKMTSCDERKKS